MRWLVDHPRFKRMEFHDRVSRYADSVEMIKWSGEERLRLCAKDIRRRAAFKEQQFRPKKLLVWYQVNAYKECCRLLMTEAEQRVADAPPDREE